MKKISKNRKIPKGPSTHGEEFVDEVSTNSRRRIFLRRTSFSSPRLCRQIIFNLILIFFAKACPQALKSYRKNEFRRKKIKIKLKNSRRRSLGEVSRRRKILR